MSKICNITLIIYYRNSSVVVALLWGRYHVPQNVYLVLVLKSSCHKIKNYQFSYECDTSVIEYVPSLLCYATFLTMCCNAHLFPGGMITDYEMASYGPDRMVSELGCNL